MTDDIEKSTDDNIVQLPEETDTKENDISEPDSLTDSEEVESFVDSTENEPDTEIVMAEETALVPQTKGDKKSKKRKRRRIDEYTPENDIKYRGPLSYRGLRIIAWSCLIISQIGLLLSFMASHNMNFQMQVGLLPFFLRLASVVMMPLFLIATFATILNGSRTFKSMLILYGGVGAIFYLLFILLHERYAAYALMFVLGVDKATAVETIDKLLSIVLSSGYMSFNIFVDLFLCTLLTFFFIYRPKRVFVGKKLIWFRLMTIIPVAYEVLSLILKLLGAFGVITVSPYLYALLPTKPPMTFVVFILIAVFLKIRENIYRKRGKTHEEYNAFLKTKANSLHFSIFVSIVMFVAGIIDLIIYLVLTIAIASNAISSNMSASEISAIINITESLSKVGIGGSFALILVAPIMMLFSYTRTHKNKRIDMFLPIIAIIVLVFVYLEGIVFGTKIFGSLANFISGGGA